MNILPFHICIVFKERTSCCLTFLVHFDTLQTTQAKKQFYVPEACRLFWAQMASASLVAISGPQKVSIFRVHPFQWPSKWIRPHTTGTLIVTVICIPQVLKAYKCLIIAYCLLFRLLHFELFNFIHEARLFTITKFSPFKINLPPSVTDKMRILMLFYVFSDNRFSK
jgi:hypothetical protein